MIKVGDIVYQRYHGGYRAGTPKTNRVGLVIREHKEKGAVPQYHVQFDQETPKWYYQHDLCKILPKGERNEND